MNHNLTMLPTCAVLATGGTVTDGPSQPIYKPELWDPDVTNTNGLPRGYWYAQTDETLPRPLASSKVIRNYHSTALLLPDGRVLCGGGDETEGLVGPATFGQFFADIYCPPYLFDANGVPRARPQLKGVQEKVNYGQTFSVFCPDPITKVVLIRPGAVTHAFNQDQHFVSLTLEGGTGPPCYQVHAPSVAERASIPPGDYLLFVLNAQGVPAISEWVRLGDEAATAYTTCDDTPPAAVANLTVQRDGISVTLSWSAPADGPGGGPVSTYEIRYRTDTPFGPSFDNFLDQGTLLWNLPTPASPGTPQSVTAAAGFDPQRAYYFRLISKDNAGSYRNWSPLSNEAIAQAAPPGGGCPTVDTRTAAGWEVENTILARSLTASASLDGYRLKRAPEVAAGRIRLRVRENEREFTTLDQVRLAYIDHPADARAYALGERVVLGTRAPAYRVTTHAGADITGVVSGSGSGTFVGEPGETLLVELVKPGAAAVPATLGPGAGDLDPFEIDPGGKGAPAPGGGTRAAGLDALQPLTDAAVLSSTGILIQGQDASGAWTTVRTTYPREGFDEFLVDTLDQGPVRLVFVGRHQLRYVGRVLPAGRALTPQVLDLLAARHSRLGDVREAVRSAGDVTTTLTPGDTLALEFAATPIAAGQVRDFFLLSRGVYQSAPLLSSRLLPLSAPPEHFALLQNRPNPFTGGTTIGFELPRSERVKLELFDLAGRRVRVLVNQAYAPGSWTAEWDRRDASGRLARPGVYLYRLEAGQFGAQRKMVLGP